MKNKNLLPLLAVAGGLYLANQSGNKASEAQNKTLAFTGDTFADEEALKDALLKIIKSNNIELRTLLRGNDGAKGEKGDTGATGLAGNQIQNYGGSLVKNGALELNNLDSWNTNGSTVIQDDNKNGLKSISVTNGYPISDYFMINPLFLVKVSFFLKRSSLSGSCYINMKGYSITKTLINKQGGPWVSSSNISTSTISEYYKKDVYFGGIGNLTTNFGEGTCFATLMPEANLTNCFFNQIIVNQVPLGEPVPHNLPYLPLNQTVLNATTGKVGIYNGTTVDYYM